MSPQAKAGAAGAILSILAWSAWYALDAGAPTDPGAPLASAASVDISPAAGPRPVAVTVPRPTVATVQPLSPLPPARASQPAPAVLRDGLEMQHGVMTAVRSPADPGFAQQARAAPPVPVMLPEGVRQEDAVVSVAGIVTVVRRDVSAATSSANDPASSPLRATEMTRAP